MGRAAPRRAFRAGLRQPRSRRGAAFRPARRSSRRSPGSASARAAGRRAARARPRACRRSRTAPRRAAAGGPQCARARPVGGRERRSSAARWTCAAPAAPAARAQGCAPVKLAQAFAPLVDLIYPPRCPSCGAAIAAQDGLCAECWAELAIPGEPACALCQRPFGDGPVPAGSICAPCLARAPRHDGVAAATLYNDASRKLVLGFKHGRRIALAPLLARLIAVRLPDLDRDWLVVPVPLHPLRLWRRGFNQSALLAREIARQRGATRPVGGLGRSARARALTGAIAARPGRRERLRGAKVVLVDDVMTSGATSDACVAALKRAGAERVVVACFARVLEEAL